MRTESCLSTRSHVTGLTALYSRQWPWGARAEASREYNKETAEKNLKLNVWYAGSTDIMGSASCFFLLFPAISFRGRWRYFAEPALKFYPWINMAGKELDITICLNKNAKNSWHSCLNKIQWAHTKKGSDNPLYRVSWTVYRELLEQRAALIIYS